MSADAGESDCEVPLTRCEDGEEVCDGPSRCSSWRISAALLGGSADLSPRGSDTAVQPRRTARLACGVAGALAVGALCALAVLAQPRHSPQAPPERLIGGVIGEDLVGGSWAGAGRCGVATNVLDNNDPAMTTFCSMDLDFWWNWAPVPRNGYTAACAWQKFLPMIWGAFVDNKWIARKAGETWGALMGYNEPDLWGPPPHPGDQYMSSGSFAPTFHCGSRELAKEWQSIVTFYKQTNPSGTIVSPAMADPSRFASKGPDAAACNASPQSWEAHMPWCLGWMQCFKDNVIRLDCGGVNCWDAIDVLQFHAYEYDAQRLIGKVKNWESNWADELNGANGRRKKTLWLTEFAHAGTTDANDPDGQATAFMEQTVGYLRSSPFVSGWSWFSQTFSSFTIDDITPASAYWSSELFRSNGQITTLGRKYQELCAATPPVPGR